MWLTLEECCLKVIFKSKIKNNSCKSNAVTIVADKKLLSNLKKKQGENPMPNKTGI